MYCPNCGKEIEEGNRFCKYCGSTITALRNREKDKGFPAKPKTKVSKSKIIIGIIVVSIISILVVNWCISMVIERKLDRRISQLRRETLLPFTIAYSDISVNALLGRISFSNIRASNTYKTVKFGCDALKLNLTYSDIIDLIKESEIDDINSCAIAFNNLKLELPGGNIGFGGFGIKFDGHINREIIENGLREFPDEPQKLRVFLKGAKIQFPEVYQELALSPALQKRISQIDSLFLKIAHDPHSKKISEEFRISTPLLSFNSTDSLRYTGNSLTDFKPEQGSSNLLLKIIPGGLQWGKPNVTGRYSLGKILMESTLDYEYSPQLNYILPIKGSLDFLIEALNAEFSGNLKQELEQSEFGQIMGMDMGKLDLDKLSIQCKYDHNQLKVFNTGLFTPFLKAVLNARTKIDEDNIEESVIENAKLIVTPLTKDMENALIRLQNKLGQVFPWERRNIVFEITGRFRDPKVKGYELPLGPFFSVDGHVKWLKEEEIQPPLAKMQVFKQPAIIYKEIDFPEGWTEKDYNFVIVPEEFSPPYKIVFPLGNLPAGLSFNQKKGEIEGKPKESGECQLKLSVIDKKNRREDYKGTIRIWHLLKVGENENLKGFNGIQMAINMAQNLDEIRIESGIYKGTGLLVPENKEWKHGIKISGGWDEDFLSRKGDTILEGEEKKNRILKISNEKGKVFVENIIFRNSEWGNDETVKREEAYGWKGAVEVESYKGQVFFTNCRFTNNYAYTGGAVSIQKSAEVIFTNCNFENNLSYINGGAVWNHRGKVIFDNCIFKNNTSFHEDGGAVSGGAEMISTNCVFENNSSNSGGAVGGWGRRFFTNCTFTNNSAASGGAVTGGGTFYNCSFYNNSAKGEFSEGGAVRITKKSTFVNSVFFGNSTGTHGGAIYGDDFFLCGCLFYGNSASSGGAILSNGNSQVTNCTFCSNKAKEKGGTIMYEEGSSNNKVINSIFYKNLAGENYNDIESKGNLEIDYCLINHLKGAANFGPHNITGDPKFVDPENDNFSLRADSPCIDKGTPMKEAIDKIKEKINEIENIDDNTKKKLVDSLSLDLAGNQRITGEKVDLGTYEWKEGFSLKPEEGIGKKWPATRQEKRIQRQAKTVHAESKPQLTKPETKVPVVDEEYLPNAETRGRLSKIQNIMPFNVRYSDYSELKSKYKVVRQGLQKIDKANSPIYQKAIDLYKKAAREIYNVLVTTKQYRKSIERINGLIEYNEGMRDSKRRSRQRAEENYKKRMKQIEDAYQKYLKAAKQAAETGEPD